MDEHFTTQTCSCCLSVSNNSPKGRAGLAIREWACGACNTTHDRDVNAAKNILCIGRDTLNHIEKSDIVPLDLRKFDKQRLEKIIDFLLSLDEKQQNKILIIQGDDDDYDK